MDRKLIMFFLSLVVAACASSQKPASHVNMPANLQPRANESLAMIVPAKGVQIYECRAKKDQPGSYEWAFVAPEAEMQAEKRLASTTLVRTGNRPMAVKSWVR